MAQYKVHLVSGNEEIKYKNLFIENLLYHKKFIKEDPILLPLDIENSLKLEQNKEIKNKYGKIFSYYTKLGFANANFTDLYNDVHKNKSTHLKTENSFTDYFITGDIKFDDFKFFNLVDYIILIIKNTMESSSYLYNFISKLTDKMLEKKIIVIISNESKIEEAANLFLKLKNEMKKLINVSFDLSFGGFLNWELKKIIHSRDKKETLIESFFEDSFHGEIKFINERLDLLENVFKNETFFENLAKINLESI